MRKRESNEGMIVSGGTVQAGAIAVGKQAKAQGELRIVSAEVERALHEKQRDDLAAKLKALEAAIEANRAQLDDEQAKAAEKRTQRVAQELTEDKPDRSILMDTLELMANSLKSVTNIATAIQVLRTAVQALF